MRIFPPTGYLSLLDARDELMRRMQEDLPSSKEIEVFRRAGLQVVDGAHATVAARALREAILSGRLSLFALFSSRRAPMRLQSGTRRGSAFPAGQYRRDFRLYRPASAIAIWPRLVGSEGTHS